MPVIANLTRQQGDPKVLSTGPSSLSAADRTGRLLGWFSIGLGLAQLFATRRLTYGLGMPGTETMMRACGAREIASGIVTLSTERKQGLWMRVAGDAMDLAVLSQALNRWNPQRPNAKLAMMAVAGVTLLDVYAALAVTRQSKRPSNQRSYSDRSGFPKGLASARGAAKKTMSAAFHESPAATH